MMNKLEQTIHRTWVQLLIENNFNEIAAIAIDSEICLLGYDPEINCYDYNGIAFDLPPSGYGLVKSSENIRHVMEHSIIPIINGRPFEKIENIIFEYRVKHLVIEDGWQDTVRRLIVRSEEPIQGIITEKAFFKKNKQPYIYNEMKFGSQSEIRIAQEFEMRAILFFPLPLAVRAEIGSFYQDHREVDFLICHEGIWGILEVSYHPDRYEKDAEKDAWFKKSGILCIQHYTAEKCYNKPKEVVDEFLEILAKHKR